MLQLGATWRGNLLEKAASQLCSSRTRVCAVTANTVLWWTHTIFHVLYIIGSHLLPYKINRKFSGKNPQGPPLPAEVWDPLCIRNGSSTFKFCLVQWEKSQWLRWSHNKNSWASVRGRTFQGRRKRGTGSGFTQKPQAVLFDLGSSARRRANRFRSSLSWGKNVSYFPTTSGEEKGANAVSKWCSSFPPNSGHMPRGGAFPSKSLLSEHFWIFDYNSQHLLWLHFIPFYLLYYSLGGDFTFSASSIVSSPEC